MFQRGPGEQFNYKAKVLQRHPTATCKRVSYNGYNGGQKLIKYLYAVHIADKRISQVFGRASDAWADAYIQLKDTN